MSFLEKAVSLTTSDADVFVCPALKSGSAHGLVFSNITGGAITVGFKLYSQASGLTTTIASALSIPANAPVAWPKPVNMVAGDKIICSASANDSIVALVSLYIADGPPPAVVLTPRGAHDSGADYVTNDIVSLGGVSYLCVTDNTADAPPSVNWMVLAEPSNDTDAITEGSTNKYFTEGRVLATLLTGLSTAAGTLVTASHTVLEAIGFLQKQSSDNATAIATKADQSTTYTKTETDTALALKANQATTYTKTETDAAIAAVVDASPAMLDTLNELAAALGDDANYAASTATALGTKEVSANKVTAISGASTDAQYPSAKLLFDQLALKETLTSAGALIDSATAKATPVDADYFGFMDSAASNVLKKLSWANLKTMLNGLYAGLGSNTFTGAQVMSDQVVSRAVLKDTSYTALAKGNSGTSTVTFDYEVGSKQSSVATGNHAFAFSNLPPAGSNAYLHVEFWGYGSHTITPPTVSLKLPAGGVTTNWTTYFAAVAAAGGPSGFATTGNVTEFLFWESVDKSVIYGKIA